MAEQDLREVLQALSGRSWADELAAWVHGTGELPLRPVLEAHGVKVLDEPAQPAQALGLRVVENHAIQVRTVLRGGAAEQAGFAAGDEWLGVVCGTGAGATSWRIQRLDDLGQYAAPGAVVTALVARDRRILHLSLQLPRAVTTWRLSARDPALLGAWLGGA